jgi:peptidoglycan hydrolase-like protein with peptidoglycan-binding domain
MPLLREPDPQRRLFAARLHNGRQQETPMMKARNLGAILALGALTALPACSHNSSQIGATTAPSSYSTASTASNSMMGTSGTVAPVSPALIRQVQTTLNQNNDYRGPVDGVWGPMTESGVRTWQQAHNLSASGEIDTATLQSMNIPAGSEANGQSGQPNGSTAATQPTGNPNYNTGPNNTAGSGYSSNNNQPPANNPAPANQGTAGSNNGATGSTTNR